VTDFDFDDSKTTAHVRYHELDSWYDIDFLEFENFTCVYALSSTGKIK